MVRARFASPGHAAPLDGNIADLSKEQHIIGYRLQTIEIVPKGPR
jgi:hypothetical protein